MSPKTPPLSSRRSPITKSALIRRHFSRLAGVYGKQNWWPAANRMEVILGAYLIQNTSWKNAEHALAQLRKRKLLRPERLQQIAQADLAELIRSSGYYRQKAARIISFLRLLQTDYQGSLRRMFHRQNFLPLREQLLALDGTGPETADSILLYAGQYSVFVVDAYAKRVFERHGLLPPGSSYEEVRAAVETAFDGRPWPRSKEKQTGHRPSRMSGASRSQRTQIFNEFHALLVQVGKKHCHKALPQCQSCPLRCFLPPGSGMVAV